MKPYKLTADFDYEQLTYPLLASPKIDGIRCVKQEGRALTGQLKPVPNRRIREVIETYYPDGWDGELVAVGGTFNDTQSLVMSDDKDGEWQWLVFDYIGRLGFDDRVWAVSNHFAELSHNRVVREHAVPLKHTRILDAEMLRAYIEMNLELYEGVCLRAVHSPYKEGRSTLREHYLLAIKPFIDAEATVVGFSELYHNTNAAFENERGLTQRSHAAAGRVPAGTLGALQCVMVTEFEGVASSVESPMFELGTGFSQDQRQEIWNNKERYLGQKVTFKYQQFGSKIAPRAPVFKGFRFDA